MNFDINNINVSSRSRLHFVDKVIDLVSSKIDCQAKIYDRGQPYNKNVQFLNGCIPLNVSIDKFKKPNVGAPIYITKHIKAYAVGNTSIIASDGYLSKDSILNKRFFNERVLKKNGAENFSLNFNHRQAKRLKV
ncbi:hypothetical protein ACT3UJ_17265, partial [Halomonas sp. 86]|uniref:hypothetical protein n=1 Tax=unclassified Halomonas TaxID=2609666 RepID=UPI00403466B5